MVAQKNRAEKKCSPHPKEEIKCLPHPLAGTNEDKKYFNYRNDVCRRRRQSPATPYSESRRASKTLALMIPPPTLLRSTAVGDFYCGQANRCVLLHSCYHHA